MNTTNQTTAQLKVRFVRKPTCLEEVMNNADPDRTASLVEIELRQNLTTAEYDMFTSSLLQDRDWLKGRGGWGSGMRSVVEVSAPERTTLFVDPSGSAYGRYVGIAAE